MKRYLAVVLMLFCYCFVFSQNHITISSITINGSPVSLGGSVTVGETKPTISSLTPSIITIQVQ